MTEGAIAVPRAALGSLRRRVGTAFAVAVLSGACAGPGSPAGVMPAGPAGALRARLDAPQVVRWAPRADHRLHVTVENLSVMPLPLLAPEGATHVEVTTTDLTRRICTIRPATTGVAVTELDPGARRSFTRDLSSCSLPPGEYRFTVRWIAAEGAAPVRITPAHGLLVVRADDEIPIPRKPLSVSPPEHPAAPRPEPDSAPRPRTPSYAALATCVDAELERLGRNAYGDPPGTVYSEAPPAARGHDRIAYVLSRVPEIRTTCQAGVR